jgi:site-specific DNA-methyltransferase (cytosine-N4-specific)
VLIHGSSTDKQYLIQPESVDLILTSPPYGDSSTTVAYGQFSRLSSQCFGFAVDGLSDIANLDNKLLGGEKLDTKHYESLLASSLTLTNVYDFFIAKINSESTEQLDKKKLIARLNDVLSFYYDLDKCLENGAYYLKKNKHFILVTGSRVVKMIKLHTDLIIAELAEKYNLSLSAIFYRTIENKRMPSKVSATNIAGEKAPTMTRESIIVLKKSK